MTSPAKVEGRPQDPTLVQRRASDPARSVWVGASAGTGKTKVLTERVLRLLLAGTGPDRILCITFTKAAAAEMANRITGLLARWATMKEAELDLALGDIQGRRPTETERARARRLFAEVLDTPGGFRIQTIHAFCQSLLRRFPIEAGVPPHFEPIDDRTAAELMTEARNRLLAAEDRETAAAVARLADWLSEADFADRLADVASERTRLHRIVALHGGPEALIAAIRSRLGVEPHETVGSILGSGFAAGSLDETALRRAATALAGGSKADLDRSLALTVFLDADPEGRRQLLDRYRKVFLTSQGEVRKSLATKPVVRAMPEIETILGAEADRLLTLLDRLRALATAEATIALVTAGFELDRIYQSLKARRAMLDFDDQIELAAGLLSRPGLAAWVLYKLDGGIDHVLVDEAQDTNPEQWEVVTALTDEFFSGETAGARDRTLFVVGDEKQSIFSFQRADPAAFAAMKRLFEARSHAVEKPWAVVPLETSFRSVEPVLAFVDRLLADDARRDGVAGEAPVHHCHRKGAAGRVEVWPLVLPRPGEPPPEWEPPTERRGIDQPGARLASAVGHTLKHWFDRGEPLEARGRAMTPGDVLILVRTRNRFFVELVRALKAEDIPIAGVDRMVLSEQLAVMDVLAMLAFLIHPDDDLTLATVLKGPLVGLDEETLFRLAHGRDGSLLAAMAGSDEAVVERAFAWLASWLKRADYLAPFETISDLLTLACPADRRSGRRAMLGRLGGEAEEPLDELLSVAAEFERSHPPAIQTFLGWLEAGGTEIKREQEQAGGRVRIMTVHGSKGLQAPVVILPDTTALPRTPAGILWPDKDLDVPLWIPRRDVEPVLGRAARERAEARMRQEYRRLLYVALTRAEDRLIVAGHMARGEAAHVESWYAHCCETMRALGEARAEPHPVLEGDMLVLARGQDHPVSGEAPQPAQIKTRMLLPEPLLRPAPAPAMPLRPLAPSRIEPEEPALRSPRLAAAAGIDTFRRGRIVHLLLQHLPDYPPDMQGRVARRLLAAERPPVDAEESEDIARQVLAVLADSEFAEIFGPSSRAEVPIAGLVGSFAVSGQVDRLAVLADRVLLVDYKTGRSLPATVAETPLSYLRQLALYRRLLLGIWPDHDVECAILWTDAPRLDRLPESLLETALP